MGERFRFVTTDGVVGQIKRRLRGEGGTFDDIDTAIAAELGVSLEQWWAYGVVEAAAHRYQTERFFAYLRREHPEAVREPAMSHAGPTGEVDPGNAPEARIGSPTGYATKRTGR